MAQGHGATPTGLATTFAKPVGVPPSHREASPNERAGRERAKRLNAHLGRTGGAVPSQHDAPLALLAG